MYSSSFYSTILEQEILEDQEKELKNMSSVK